MTIRSTPNPFILRPYFTDVVPILEDSQDIEVLAPLFFPIEPEWYVAVCPVIGSEYRARNAEVVDL